ncbi:BRCA1-associated ATM activator 1-like [Ylistrum balloti]|uniref:BRCA1-associated ATM activator 1-like n=1 Tax=Ylistrum balloti TaxID=509963 RepID=UPI002905A9AA|nr:BRCA1-associated ATM activator 1-like [Ylistrum balloti]
MEGDFEEKLLLEKIAFVLNDLVSHQNTNRDDTCFQKFSDLLHSRLKSSKHAEQCGIIPFLTSALKETNIETSLLVFSVNLAGILGQIPDLDSQQRDFVETFMDMVLREQDLNNPSIGTEYFETLRKLITFRTTNGNCVYKCKNGRELMLKCWQILTDRRSLFLTSAVLRFLKDYLGQDDLHVEESNFTTIFQKVVSHICQVHMCTINFDPLHLPSILPSVLQLFQDIPRVLIETLDRTIVMKSLKCLGFIVCNMNKETCLCALEALLSLQSKLDVHGQGEFESLLKQLPHDLVEKDILRSQEVCIKMLKNGLHEEMVKDLLLCPLYVITGWSHLVQTSELHTNQILIHMDSKSTSIQTILNSLEVYRLTDVPQDVMEAIIELFALTHDGGRSKTHVTCHLFHSTRIQQRCLELFVTNQSRLSCGRQLCGSVLDVMKTESLDHVTFSKCLDVLCVLTPEMLLATDSMFKDGEAFDQCLTNTLQFSLCCIDWERRDTTLVFLTKLLSSCQDRSEVTAWLKDSRLCLYIYQTLDDSNSYVRATALTSLQRVLESSKLTTYLLQQCDITMDDIIRKVLTVLQDDTEAFARRECISFVTRMWSSVHGDLKVNTLQILVERTSNDFDWEVKAKLVDFWEMLIEEGLTGSDVQLPSYVDSLLPSEKHQNFEQTKGAFESIEELVKTGCFDSLLKLLYDYDQSVCEKACTLLLRVMKHLSVHFEQHNSVQSDSAIPAKRMKTSDSETNIESIYHKLKCLNLTARLLEVSTTCDEYDKNPMSLLEDMLSYSNKADQEDENNAVDCY